MAQRFLRALRCRSCSLVVVASTQTAEPSITLVLTDHHFRLSAPVEGGTLRWRVKHDGTEPHQALVRLPEGVSE